MLNCTNEVIVYGLTTAFDDYQIRYVGQTRRLEGRIRQHLAVSYRRRTERHLRAWLTGRLDNSCKILVVVLKQNAVWNEDERFFIQNLRDRGLRLVNMTDGGDGGATFAGRRHTTDTRLRISNGRLGIKFSEDHRRNLSIAQAKRFVNPDQRHNSGYGITITKEQTRGYYDRWIAGETLKDIATSAKISGFRLNTAIRTYFGDDWRNAVPDRFSRPVRLRWERAQEAKR